MTEGDDRAEQRNFPERRPERARSAEAGATRRVAAFDFDGTISERDSLGPFLARVCGRGRLYREMALRSPRSPGWRSGSVTATRRRRRLVGRLLTGYDAAAMPRSRRSVTRDEPARGRRAPARDARAHRLAPRPRARGRSIVSASLDVYLEPLAPLLGVDQVLCTKLGVGPDGRLDGTLVGGNVRGAEKVRRLQAWLGGDAVELWAYGDSAGDRELLAFADHPTWMRDKQH